MIGLLFWWSIMSDYTVNIELRSKSMTTYEQYHLPLNIRHSVTKHSFKFLRWKPHCYNIRLNDYRRKGGREGWREGSKELRSYKLYVLWKTEDLWDTKYGIERERWQIQSANGTYDKQKHLKQTYQTLGDTSLYTHFAIIWNNNFTHSLSLSTTLCLTLL